MEDQAHESSKVTPENEPEHKLKNDEVKHEPKSTKHEDAERQLSVHSDVSKEPSVAYTEANEKAAVKNTRKKIENDIQLLKNRVRMLQKEKEKADKKIVETKSKAEEIMKRKNENDRLYEKRRDKERQQKLESEKQK